MGEPKNVLHDLWIFGAPGNPYLWIGIYQIAFESLRKFHLDFEHVIFEHRMLDISKSLKWGIRES